MKIWIVQDGSNTRNFFDESSFNFWLINKKDVSKLVVEIYEATFIESKKVEEIKNSIKEANIRESRIQAVVSDDTWFSKYENFKVELAKYSNTASLIEKLNLLGNDKKVINKYLKAQKEFLLCQIIDDVKWFELLIDFLDIKEMVDSFYQKLNGYNTMVRVSKKRKENFLKAKENVQKTL